MSLFEKEKLHLVLFVTRMVVMGFVRATCSRGGSVCKDWFDRAGKMVYWLTRNVLSVADFVWAKEGMELELCGQSLENVVVEALLVVITILTLKIGVRPAVFEKLRLIIFYCTEVVINMREAKICFKTSRGYAEHSAKLTRREHELMLCDRSTLRPSAQRGSSTPLSYRNKL